MKSKFPEHIAIIMDGNGRWAQRQRFFRVQGHRRGAETVRNITIGCREIGIKVLTLYAFSEENWSRPKAEISQLMKILKEFLISERQLMVKNDIRLRAIGDLNRLPKDVLETLHETMKLTENFKSMQLVLALSYGGRNEITRAVQTIAEKAKKGLLEPQNISPEVIAAHLDTAEFPDPDLLIRTSGEFRTSNFLPWQTTYSEIYFTATHWPDFTVEELERAIEDYSGRERRFGLTTEQLESEPWLAAR